MKTLIIMGMVALGIGQITAEVPNLNEPTSPDVLVPIRIDVRVYASGGQTVYECDPGRLPWAGQCRRITTGIQNGGCGDWSRTFSINLTVRCDTNLHTLPSRTYWVQKGNRFDNIGTVTPTYQLQSCFYGPYVFDNMLTANINGCPPVGNCDPVYSWYCPCQDVDPNDGYVPGPTCCDNSMNLCRTCRDQIGELWYCCCCIMINGQQYCQNADGVWVKDKADGGTLEVR